MNKHDVRKYDQFLDGSVKLGTWLSVGSPVVAELAAQFSFSWLLLDLEHGSSPEAALPGLLRATAGGEAAAIVRVPELHAATIARVLDWGADGIMLPHVSSAQQAADCVAAMRYPPAGHRGYSTTVRAYRYGMEPSADPTAVRPLFLAQIEDAEGVRHAYDIAAVEGVDVLFVGPGDLKLALAHQPDADAISFEDALRQVAGAAEAHGKQAGILLRNRDDFTNLASLGYRCMAIDSDLGILRKGYQDILAWYEQLNLKA
ncbi:2-dehydro-3-deoxyglucarate aldolase/4-hydroxy-2-oxoheptanedioate aldolase [Parapedobacter composti]|uniref:2-dehydro-3-deoxyglucarate aldolase/4-hydroxy-2-oxoheptanedioate aldolase n=1 Tax=Parapedobacter composti TaxID=623281 RepID=A0A1I1JUT9_9SPHI|nr:aldolase/citrate lyase family protein [Parapedobacter composti]SFC52439.1 2-dehydro-3-deoxyglucarate aldolase/4-hydroxy-2-oxoheptanedioate aldolase [Parapedobacter composti]